MIATVMAAPQRGGGPQSELLRKGQQLSREGKLDEALVAYQEELKSMPGSPQALNAAGTVLDLMGKGQEARTYFQKAIDGAASPAAKANAQRQMAMSFAFDSDCQNTVKYEQMVFDYYVSIKDFYQQGEIADEAALVCINSGDLNTAEKWYKIGHDAGIQQTDMPPGRKELWEFRYQNALARLAVRRGNKAEAEKHVGAAKAALDLMKTQDAQMGAQQTLFFGYLTGYVALYSGEYQKALDLLPQGSQNDVFVQCLIGQAYEKLGDKEKAMEAYRKAAAATAHNPPAAFARPFARKKLT